MFEPIIRGGTPTDALKNYLAVETDTESPTVCSGDTSIGMCDLRDRGKFLDEQLIFLFEEIGEGKYRLKGWLTNQMYRDGQWEKLMPMESSSISFWVFISLITGKQYKDWRYIKKREDLQKEEKLLDISTDNGLDVSNKAVRILKEVFGG